MREAKICLHKGGRQKHNNRVMDDSGGASSFVSSFAYSFVLEKDVSISGAAGGKDNLIASHSSLKEATG